MKELKQKFSLKKNHKHVVISFSELRVFLTSCVVGRANHWSALIGASHSRSYVLWEYGGYASEGVRQVAEFGSPIKMEEEIRQKVGLPSYGFSVGSHPLRF